MASDHGFVTVSGRLVGMGQDVACTVFAQKLAIPGFDTYNYARAHIVDHPTHLPDGIYSVTFDGTTLRVQRQNCAWTSLVG
jgi:hypothetical protein